MKRITWSLLGVIACFLISIDAAGQTASPAQRSAAMSTPAYAEILLRKTELESELESQLTEYTEEFPKVKELRYQVSVLEKETTRVLAVKAADSGKLSQALGRLIVRKCELETDLWKLQNQYKDGHPDVKRAKRKLEIFEQAIKNILG